MMSAQQTSAEEVPEWKYGNVIKYNKSLFITRKSRMKKVTYI